MQIQAEYARIRREHQLPLTSPIHRYHVLEEGETPSSQQRAAVQNLLRRAQVALAALVAHLVRMVTAALLRQPWHQRHRERLLAPLHLAGGEIVGGGDLVDTSVDSSSTVDEASVGGGRGKVL